MGWAKCSRCGFTQIPADRCLRCGGPLGAPPAPAGKQPEVPAGSGSVPPRRISSLAAVAGIALLLLLAGALLWSRRLAPSGAQPSGGAEPTPAPWALDLSGRWQGQVSKLVAGPPPRPVLKEAMLETDANGDVVAARAVLSDPGRGGAGAGYVIVPDGPRRLQESIARLAGSPGGARVPVDFIPYAPWVPARERLWRALEGQRQRPQEIQYLLLESVEDDYLVQAGINQTGFLSYVFFSREYASGRGTDVLSRIIRPEPSSSLRGFRNLVWDLSGAADFVTLRVRATFAGPDGQTDRLVLTR